MNTQCRADFTIVHALLAHHQNVSPELGFVWITLATCSRSRERDGVITDTAEFHYLAWKKLADEENIPFSREDNEALRGVSRRESLNRMLKGREISEETAQLWMARKNEYYLEHLNAITPDATLPGVTKFLTAAHAARLKLGIGSASKNARLVLERLELTRYFDVIGDGYSVHNPKPAPDLFVWVAGGLRVNANQVVVFEDAEAGIDAATQAGCFTVGIGNSNVSHANIHLPDGLAQAEVGPILKQLEALNRL